MSDYKRMFELKQSDWIEACKQIDALQAELAEARALEQKLRLSGGDLIMQLNQTKAELAEARASEANFKLLFETSCKSLTDQLAQTRAVLAVRTRALEKIKANPDWRKDTSAAIATQSLASTGTEELSAIKSAIQALEIAYNKLSELPWKGGASGPTWITKPLEAIAALKKYFGGGGE